MHRPERGKGATLAGQAYLVLRERIISADYPPGQFLQEVRLCNDLQFGRTPIRQAVLQLSRDGLIDVIHGKGIIVRGDSLKELLLALEARLLVEPYCASLCAEKASSTDIAALEKLHRKYLSARQDNERRTLMEIDRSIHALISKTAGNPLLMQLLGPIQERMSRMWLLPNWQLSDLAHTADEHERLISAIRGHHCELAGAAMKMHLLSLKDRITSGGVIGAAN